MEGDARGALDAERACLENGNGDQRIGAELIDGQREAVGEGAAHDMDAFAVRGKEI